MDLFYPKCSFHQHHLEAFENQLNYLHFLRKLWACQSIPPRISHTIPPSYKTLTGQQTLIKKNYNIIQDTIEYKNCTITNQNTKTMEHSTLILNNQSCSRSFLQQKLHSSSALQKQITRMTKRQTLYTLVRYSGDHHKHENNSNKCTYPVLPTNKRPQ